MPSGLKWATCNVGTGSPEGYGDYFAWGETGIQSIYDADNCPTYEKDDVWLRSNGYIYFNTGDLGRFWDFRDGGRSVRPVSE